jgi:L-fuconolactonase
MIHIDSHQHFWKYDAGEYGWIDDSMKSLRRTFMPEDLEPDLERNGFDGCVAVQARQTLSKLTGIRHIVQSEPDDRFLLRSDFLSGIAMLEEFNLTYDILIYTRHLPAAAEFVAGFERQRFVLDHLAKPDIRGRELVTWSQALRKLAKFQNVYCKLSGLVTEADWDNWTEEDFIPYLDVAFECFGAARLMIGSDWPVCTVAGNYSRVVDVVKNYLQKFPSEVREAVLGETAREVYRLCES